MDNKDTGLLLDEQNIKLQRTFFEEMVRLLGINVLFRQPIESAKQYNIYGELDAHFHPAKIVGCIFDEHPNQKTMRKLGWNTETADTNPVIHVPYDLPVEAGALFIIPSGLDKSEGRVFRVLRMTNIAVYPASIACEIGPVFQNTSQQSEIHNFKNSNTNVLRGEEDEYDY